MRNQSVVFSLCLIVTLSSASLSAAIDNLKPSNSNLRTALNNPNTTLGGIKSITSNYPKKPDLLFTPGDLCHKPDELRYNEQISYCERNVGTDEKWTVINRYSLKYKFSINSSNRAEFKIDHFIPLCMGGSNDLKNLWPQHMSIFIVTDIIEKTLCEKMAMGLMKQNEAIALIKRVKLDLSQSRSVMSELDLIN